MDSFLYCCLDKDLIYRWIINDDGSPEEDLMKMQSRYPFLEIYLNDGRGQAANLNSLFSKVQTEWLFHCEDDWEFIKKGHFIRRLFDVAFDDEKIKNVTLRDWSGNEVESTTLPAFKYNVHKYVPGRATDEMRKKTNCEWYGFTFNPSLHHLPTIKSLGNLDESFDISSRRWDRPPARKYMKMGLKVANLVDGPWIEHIGQGNTIYEQRLMEAKTMIKWSGNTPEKIHEVELNFSNLCMAGCIFCSRYHGVGNIPLMQPETFNILVEQLKDVEIGGPIQTSGNGEVFLNLNYLDYVRTLKREFPEVDRWIYNNFSMMTEERSGAVVNEELFDRIHVRIDSLHKWIFERNSNLNFENVMRNLEYFMSINDKIHLVILYNDINIYYNRCKSVIGKRPTRDYYTDKELSKVPDEMNAIESHFRPLAKSSISFCKINPCLWGERHQAPQDTITPCPKINVIKNVVWVVPNGDVMACCYCDRQDEMYCGNITKEHILDIFYGVKRAEWIRKIENREIIEHPCNNPRCCGFGDGVEAK